MKATIEQFSYDVTSGLEHLQVSRLIKIKACRGPWFS